MLTSFMPLPASADSMRVLVYEGQAQRLAGRTTPVVTAAQLAAVDIVLTTYEVLRRDVHHQPAAAAGGRSMRGRKKYEVRRIRQRICQ